MLNNKHMNAIFKKNYIKCKTYATKCLTVAYINKYSVIQGKQNVNDSIFFFLNRDFLL